MKLIFLCAFLETITKRATNFKTNTGITQTFNRSHSDNKKHTGTGIIFF
jgi:hypothetical protein